MFNVKQIRMQIDKFKQNTIHKIASSHSI